jgi:nucleoside-diphosphate-sugar epimerase
VAAIDHGTRGIYNVVDDDPAPVAEWLPALAEAIGAPKPWRVPRWVARLAAGEAGAVMMTDLRGASNAKAKRELGWQPRHASWRQGFVEVARPGGAQDAREGGPEDGPAVRRMASSEAA